MPVPPETIRRIEEARASAQPVLDLGDLEMDAMPEELRDLPALQVLALGKKAVWLEGDELKFTVQDSRPNQPFETLDVLHGMPNLLILSLSECTSLVNVDALKELHGLFALDLSECTSLTNVDALKELRGLNTLSLDTCKSLTNVDAIKELHGLQALDLSACTSLANFDGLSELRGLQTLYLTGCTSLTNFDALKELRGLNTLNLSMCTSLTNVDALKELHGLQTLSLSGYTSLANVDALKELRTLQTLDLARCKSLTNVDALKELRGLQTLDLSGCRSLTNVDGLSELRGLQTLYLTGCESLTNVDALKDMCSLRSLSLRYCVSLSHFSPLRNLLPHLHELLLVGCRFTDLDPAACGEMRQENVLDAVRAYYEDSKHGLRADEEVKVFILGNGGVGKTQLCRRLRGKPLIENSSSTLGIHVKHINIAIPGRRSTPVRLNLWDFGGQDIYHGTHHLFLHERAVFILLWTPETESGEYVDKETGFRWRHRPLVYWLDYIRSLSQTAPPVLLVRGKCDLNSNQTQLPDSLPGDFSSLVPLEFSANQDEKLQCLRAELEKAVATVLEQPQPKIPTSRVELAHTLRDMLTNASNQPGTKRPRTLSLKDFRTLCKENARISKWREALKSLHHRGVVYWRPDLFRGRIVLDQSWALKAIYALFNLARKRPDLFPGGRFTLDTLAGAWEKEHSESLQRTFLGMMKSCGICFRVRRLNPGEDPPRWQYIAPELLPEFNTPDVQSQIVAPLPSELPTGRMAVRYGFLHEGLLRRFLSWLGDHVGDKAVYWKYGCRFYHSRSGVQMNIDTLPNAWKNGQAGPVTLEAWGERAAQWLEACHAALTWMSPTQIPDVERTDFETPDRAGGKYDDVTPDAIVTRHRAGSGLGRLSIPTPGRDNKGAAIKKWRGCYLLVKLLLKKKPGDRVSQRNLCKVLEDLCKVLNIEDMYSAGTVGNYLRTLEKIAEQRARIVLFQFPEEESGVPVTLLSGAAKGLDVVKQYIEEQLDIIIPNWRKQPWAK